MPALKMEIRLTNRFEKEFQKVDLKIRTAFSERLKIFKQEPFHPILKNHSLTGKYRGYRSINVTGDWRALYTEGKSTIWFEALGTHSQLYKS